MKPDWQDKEYGIELYCGDCLDIMPGLGDSSVSHIATDPPYFKVKGDAWDRQWDKPQEFLAWLDKCCEQWARIMQPNGSLYCFASPQMSARVECLIAKRLNVLNCVRWCKEAGWHNKTEKEALRSYLSPWESIIFAEHYGSDNIAKGEAGYNTKCDELRGFVFEPLQTWFREKIECGGLNHKKINLAIGSCTSGGGMASHYFGDTGQYSLPTNHMYCKMKTKWPELFGREYEDLRREYEDLRREYEDLRRPFSVSTDVPFSDVWTFSTVQAYVGKHPCEKPQPMLEHIINASSKPNGTVFDSFLGTGSCGVACVNLGRKFIGIEMNETYFDIAVKRISQAIIDKQGGEMFATHKPDKQAEMFKSIPNIEE